MGHYVLHEPTRDVAGMLDPVHDDGCDAAVFRWSDLYGTGVARLQFFPDRHCFEGAWTLGDRNPTLDWQSCTRERVTS